MLQNDIEKKTKNSSKNLQPCEACPEAGTSFSVNVDLVKFFTFTLVLLSKSSLALLLCSLIPTWSLDNFSEQNKVLSLT